jgi:sugar fermentation stimulation protein A
MPPRSSPLASARFVARPNRFIVRARLDDGSEIDAHLADPGRLKELLIPGAALRLRPAAPGSLRKTRYSVALVRASEPPRAWVSVAASRANDLAEPLLQEGAIDGISDHWNLQREVRHGRSRFDFRLQDKQDGTAWVEVKSVTFVENGIARFPDAPTERGTRHVRELEQRARAGDGAMVLFVAQREDVQVVTPYDTIDPEFSEALRRAQATGVQVRAVRFRMDPDGEAFCLGPVPVVLAPGEAEKRMGLSC